MATDFFETCKTGTVADIKAALGAGASLSARNAFDRTAIMCAAGNNPDAAVLAALLAAGASVTEANKNGKSPLMLAAAYNTNPAIVLALLAAGADAKAKDAAGKTVLEYAAENAALKGTPALESLRKAGS